MAHPNFRFVLKEPEHRDMPHIVELEKRDSWVNVQVIGPDFERTILSLQDDGQVILYKAALKAFGLKLVQDVQKEGR